MMKNIIFLFFVFASAQMRAMEWNMFHQLTGSSRIFEKKSFQQFQFKGVYQPEISVSIWQIEQKGIDLQMIGDISGTYFKKDSNSTKEISAEMYRSWLRFSASLYEFRLGLQQLNFGTSTLLRPLKWFDTIDPRDSNKKTEGVYALLTKKYFLNNANIWGWIILDDTQLNKKTEYSAFKKAIELGGRLQYPFEYCEAAVSIHHKKSDDPGFNKETKVGFDARWDMSFGFWVESSFHVFSNSEKNNYSHFLAFGSDYTFGFGNGVYALLEHLFYSNLKDEISGPANKLGSTAFQLSYPTSMLDSIQSIITYDWQLEQLNYFISYKRAYDFISIYLNFYWNPLKKEFLQTNFQGEGKSVELMLETKF